LFDLAVLMEPPSQPPHFAAAAPARSRAQERRARKRRAEARVRLQLAADHKLLTEHHASQPPSVHAAPFGPTVKMEQLLEAMLAQQQALFMCISGLYGWQAGSGATVSHDAPEGPRSGSPSGHGAGVPLSGAVAGGNVEISMHSVADARETSPSSVDHRASDFGVVGEQVEHLPSCSSASVGVGGIGGSKDTLCEPTGSGTRSLVASDVPISYQQFLLSDHYDYFKTDLTVSQLTYLDSFKHDGFPCDWRLLDVLSHLLDLNPSNPQSDLGDFTLSYFYMLAMVRRGEADAKLQLDDLSADEKDAVFVRFVRTAMVEKCGSS
jgi:hypothetical protein